MQTTFHGRCSARSGSLTSLVTLLLALLLGGCGSDSSDSGNEDDHTDPQPDISVTSQVTGFELGVSDLDMSLPVYRDGLGMTVVSDTNTDNSRQVTLTSPGSPFEATLTLIEFTDGLGRNLQDNPGKLVFLTPDATALAGAFANSGGVVSLPPMEQPGFGVVGFGRDPDNNLIEIAQTDQLPITLFGAVGIGASNLEQARDFYRDEVGLTERQFIATGSYDEYIMGSPEGQSSLSLVLMHWTDGVERRYTDNVTRVRLISDAPQALTNRTWADTAERAQDLDGNWLIIGEEPANLGNGGSTE